MELKLAQPAQVCFALREEVLVAYIIIQDEVVIVRVFRGGQDYENILGAAQDD